MGLLNSDQRKLELVVQSGLLLAKNLDLQTIVQAATDAGLELCGAQFGAFFYNVLDKHGERYALYTLSGVAREKFAKFPMPRNTGVFAPTFEGTGIVRSADITKDPRYGQNAPYKGMPEGHLPVRSYLAVPVKASSGEVLGGLFYGHEEAGIFELECEELLAMVAAQAAAAIENVRLREQLTRKIADLEKSKLNLMNVSGHVTALAAIVESSDDVILSKDLNGRITSWNQAAVQIFGFSKEEMVGRPIFDLVPAHLHEEERAILGRIRNGEKLENYETLRLSKDGRTLHVDLGISPLRDSSGAVVGSSSILRDLTRRKNMEKALIQAEKLAAAGRMAATIAHEINNPLEAVLNLVFLIKTNAANSSQVLAYAEDAETELIRIAHLARQTLGFYREHSAVALISISSLVADVLRIYGPRCKTVGALVKASLNSEARLVLRTGEMMQVISNLIINAIYAMPDGGDLSVTVEDIMKDDGPAVRLSIEDTGCGIPHQHRERIFEPFFTTRHTIGTGIGLFIARQFVEGHGGTIEFETSTDPSGHGTCFSIVLPQQTVYADILLDSQLNRSVRF
ncbi:PAS domain S-box protein [Terriglobus albidus]|uniref:histidine kinase n=1 Tax=Terriglobus albidus TaxID=1592106 RepID=A0A5B9EHQ0_9BACT|nr:sensor histidine kinase [Terriglobus albidus]QEE29596.1 PAS domain S-box protein [Terriglobus albidus]